MEALSVQYRKESRKAWTMILTSKAKSDEPCRMPM